MPGNGYPIVLDVSGRLVVIVGGGNVAVRKVKGLLDSGATRVRVVSPRFDPKMPGGIEKVEAMYQAEHLQGASLVFAATDSPDVNDTVVQDAHKIGALTCRADVDEDNAGDFATPAMLRDGPLLITVSSGGSPAFSAMIRDKIGKAIDPRWKALADAMQSLRPMIRRSLSPSRRREVFIALCSDDAVNELTQGGVERLKQWLKSGFPELKE